MVLWLCQLLQRSLDFLSFTRVLSLRSCVGLLLCFWPLNLSANIALILLLCVSLFRASFFSTILICKVSGVNNSLRALIAHLKLSKLDSRLYTNIAVNISRCMLTCMSCNLSTASKNFFLYLSQTSLVSFVRWSISCFNCVALAGLRKWYVVSSFSQISCAVVHPLIQLRIADR